MRAFNRLCIRSIFVFFLFFGCSSPAQAVLITPPALNSPIKTSTFNSNLPTTNLSDPSKDKPAFVKGLLIVKFKPTLTQSAQGLLVGKKQFKTAMSNGSGSLDALNEKYKVKSAKSLFMNREGMTTSQALEKQRQDFEKLKQKFPKRTARAPKDAVMPDMTNIYILEVPEETNIEAMAEEYKKDPNVEFANPDYIAHTLFTPNDPYFSSSNSWGAGISGHVAIACR